MNFLPMAAIGGTIGKKRECAETGSYCCRVDTIPASFPLWRSSSTLAQIRNRSSQIGIVDQLEAAFAASLAGGNMRGVFGIGEEALDCLCRGKLHKRD